MEERNGATEGDRDKVSWMDEPSRTKRARRTGEATRRTTRRQGDTNGYVDRGIRWKVEKKGCANDVEKVRERERETAGRNGVPSRKLNECTYNVRLVCPRHSRAKTQTGRGCRETVPVF